MDIEELKLFLKVDNDEEDDLLTSLQGAAEEYLSNTGINIDYTKKLYQLAIKILVGHWYENRGAIIIGSISKDLEFSLSTMITQLKYTQVEV